MDDSTYWKHILEREYPFNGNNINHKDQPVRVSQLSERAYCMDWQPTDSNTVYDKNVKCNNPKLSYGIDDIEYHMNKDYFRCDDLENISKNNKPVLLAFGCSFTFGIGLPEHETWPVILSKMIKEKTGEDVTVVNFGSPGSGMDEVSRLSNYIHLFNVKYISCLKPPSYRKTYISGDNIIKSFHVNCEPDIHDKKSDKTLYKLLNSIAALHPQTLEYKEEIVNKKLESIAKIINVPYSIISSQNNILNQNPDWATLDKTLNLMKNKYDITKLTDFARDCQHPGNIYQLTIAHRMKEILFNE